MFHRRASWAACVCVAQLVLGCSSSEHSDLFSPDNGAGGGGVATTGVTTSSSATTTGSGTMGTSSSATGSSAVTTGTGSGGATGSSATSAATGGQGGGSMGAGGANSTGSGNAGTAGSSPGAGGAAGATGTTGMGGSGMAGSGGAGGGAGGAPGTGGAAGSASSGGAAGAGGSPGGVGATCAANDGCRTGLYCKKVGCGPVDLLGKCATRPTSCDFNDSPICGCDGFTYLNVCLAELNGQNVAAQPGICKDGVAITCTPGDKSCAARPNSACGVIVADHAACPSAVVPGKCWVLPNECVPTGTHYDSCDGDGKCIHTCDVVKDEIPYYPAPELCGG